MTATKQRINTHIKWMVRRDMPAVLAIEAQCFELPWLETDFIQCLRNRNVIGMVATVENDTVVAGFMIYELHKHRLHVLDFAVHDDWRYKGIGASMVKKLTTKLSSDRRSRVTLEIRDSNLDAQLFFKRMGFLCVRVLRDFYDDTTDDAYLFQFRYADA